MAPAPLSVLPTFTSPTEPPTRLPADTRNAILGHLTATNKVTALNTMLRNELVRSGWTQRVKELSLELLRSGQCSTFEQVITEVVRRAGSEWDWAKQTTVNGYEPDGKADPEGEIDVKVPKEAVEKGVGFMKDALKRVVEVERRERNGT